MNLSDIHSRAKNILGQSFGRLTVIEFLGHDSANFAIWRCLCSCGQELTRRGHALTRRYNQSCGCLHRERQRARLTKHGLSKSLTYGRWVSMKLKSRICTRWEQSFKNFLEDMGQCPEQQYVIARKNHDLEYSKENCLWATKGEQIKDTSRLTRLTLNGETKIAAEWSKDTGIPSWVISRRLKAGWPIHLVLKPGLTRSQSCKLGISLKPSRKGAPRRPRRQKTEAEIRARFWDKIKKTADCWIWTGALRSTATSTGYGHCVWGGRHRGAHIIAYELLVGPIPTGLELDHKCRNTLCVNPDHLEPVTHYENVVVRGRGPFAERARQTHCKRGHPFTEENTYIHKSRKVRICRTCHRDRASGRI